MSELQYLLYKSNEITSQLIESGGELTPDMENSLATIDMKTPAAVDAASFLIQRMEHEEAYWKEMAEKYSLIAKGCKTTREKMKEAIKIGMLQLGLSDLEGRDVRFKISKAKPKLVVNADYLDPNYLTTKTITEPNNEKIRSDLEQGLEVEGAMLLESHSLRSYVNKGSEK